MVPVARLLLSLIGLEGAASRALSRRLPADCTADKSARARATSTIVEVAAEIAEVVRDADAGGLNPVSRRLLSVGWHRAR